MASIFTLLAVLNPPLTGREAVVDALYRCVGAFDTNDAALFDTTFMTDGVFEVSGRPMEGLAQIHEIGLPLIFKVDTTHLVSAVRVNMKTSTTETGTTEENEASLTCTVIAQHFPKGKGNEPGQNHLMSGCLYRAELAKDTDGLWKFRHLKIEATWVEGDYSIIGGKFDEQ